MESTTPLIKLSPDAAQCYLSNCHFLIRHASEVKGGLPTPLYVKWVKSASASAILGPIPILVDFSTRT